MNQDATRLSHTYPTKIIGQAFKESYPFACPKCGAQLHSRPTVAMRMGVNVGSGNCTKCDCRFFLSIDNNNERMEAEARNHEQA